MRIDPPKMLIEPEDDIAKELIAIIRSEVTKQANELAKQVRDETIREMREQVLAEFIAKLPKPEKGEKGNPGDRGEKGDQGIAGIAGRDGLPGIAGRDGKDGAPGQDGKDGAPGSNGKDGRDGIDANLRAHYQGPWRADRSYTINQTVQYGGSCWICMVDNPKGKPEDKSGDWALFVKRGRDGKDGERGPPGPMGPPGKPAEY